MSIITRTYTFTDGTVAYGSQVDAEISNITNTLNSLDSAGTTWTNVKVTTLLPQADVNAGGYKITNLGTAINAGDALGAGMPQTVANVMLVDTTITAAKIANNTITNTQMASGAALANLGATVTLFQVVQGSTTTTTSTTSSSFTATAITASITPSSTSHKVKVSVSGTVKNNNGNATTLIVTLVRNAVTNLATSTSDGFFKLNTIGSAVPIITPFSIVYYDSPASTSATSYTVYIASSDNTTSVSTSPNTTTSVILLEEIG